MPELTPLVLYPVPVTVTPEMVTLELPLLVSVVPSEPLLPRSTFPKLKLVGAHLGDPWAEEMVYIARRAENVWVDISHSAFLLYKFHRAEFYRKMQYLKAFLPDRTLFSTDWPASNRLYSLKDSVDIIKNLKIPEPLKEIGYSEWTQEEKDKLLGENAAKLLKLK